MLSRRLDDTSAICRRWEPLSGRVSALEIGRDECWPWAVDSAPLRRRHTTCGGRWQHRSSQEHLEVVRQHHLARLGIAAGGDGMSSQSLPCVPARSFFRPLRALHCLLRNFTHATRALTDVAGRWQAGIGEAPSILLYEIQARAPPDAVVYASPAG